MLIKILGSRGQVPVQTPKIKKHSGILIDKKILIDVGEEEFLKTKPKFILISHFHYDHAFFARGNQKIELSVPIYAPEQNKNVKGVKTVSRSFTAEGYKISPIPTMHSFKLKSQGYLIEKDEKRIFYSGDLITIEEKYRKKLKDLDLVITEASFIKKGGLIRRNPESGRIYGHGGVPNLVNLFKNFTDHILFMHFGTWYINDPVKGDSKIKKLQENNLMLETGYDGKEIVI